MGDSTKCPRYVKAGHTGRLTLVQYLLNRVIELHQAELRATAAAIRKLLFTESRLQPRHDTMEYQGLQYLGYRAQQ